MSDKTKILGALVLGAITGVILTKFFESEKGKEIVDIAKDKVNNTASDIKEKINQLEKELAELIEKKSNSETKS